MEEEESINNIYIRVSNGHYDGSVYNFEDIKLKTDDYVESEIRIGDTFVCKRKHENEYLFKENKLVLKEIEITMFNRIQGQNYPVAHQVKITAYVGSSMKKVVSFCSYLPLLEKVKCFRTRMLLSEKIVK